MDRIFEGMGRGVGAWRHEETDRGAFDGGGEMGWRRDGWRGGRDTKDDIIISSKLPSTLKPKSPPRTWDGAFHSEASTP